MNKPFIIFVVALIIICLAFIVFRKDDMSSLDGDVFKGAIVNVDSEQILFDGPYVIVMETDKGVQEVINIPSMGLPLCAARESIAGADQYKVGKRIEVKGAITPTGLIVPCESPDHYLKITD